MHLPRTAQSLATLLCAPSFCVLFLCKVVQPAQFVYLRSHSCSLSSCDPAASLPSDCSARHTAHSHSAVNSIDNGSQQHSLLHSAQLEISYLCSLALCATSNLLAHYSLTILTYTHIHLHWYCTITTVPHIQVSPVGAEQQLLRYEGSKQSVVSRQRKQGCGAAVWAQAAVLGQCLGTWRRYSSTSHLTVAPTAASPLSNSPTWTTWHPTATSLSALELPCKTEWLEGGDG